MKKLLIIGDANSIFVKDFITQYAFKGCQIDLISPTNSIDINGVRKIYTYKATSRSRALVHLKMHYHLFSIIKKLDTRYDAVVIHYVHYYLAPHIKQLKKTTTNLIAVIWGSDFYRVKSKIKLRLQDRIFASVDSIVFTNPKTKEQFLNTKNKIKYDKCHVAGFGLPVLNEIDKLTQTELNYNKYCQMFNLPINKLKVLIGYNANLSHNQLLIIDEISKLQPHILDSIHLVFPLAYGSKRSKQIILSELHEKEINNFTILEKFYNFQDTAKLRKITDILINIQPSDQFSGSMQETLYAGNTIIAGSWLPYERIIRHGANIYSIDTPEAVGKALTDLVTHPNRLKPKNLNNMKNYINSLSSWHNNLVLWDSIIFYTDSDS